MILRRLAVNNFGCLADGEWVFTEGANVVVGPNEAGKSTLAEAVVQALLGSTPVTTVSNEALRRKTWGRQEMYRLEAEFAHGGQEWRVVRDFVEGKSRLENLTTGEAVRQDTNVRQKLAEMVRLTADRSEEQYLATGYLRQGEWEAVAQATGVTDLLAQVVEASGGRGLSARIRKLKHEREEFSRGLGRPAPKNPGPVAQARENVENLRRQMEGADGLRERARKEEEAMRKLDEATEELEKIEAELREARPRLEAATGRREIESSLKAVREKLEEITKVISEAERLQGEMERCEVELKSRRPITVDEVKKLEQMQERAAELRREATQKREEAAATLQAAQRKETGAAQETREEAGQAPVGVSPMFLVAAVVITLVGVAFLGAALALGAKVMVASRIALAILGAAMAAAGPIFAFHASAAVRARQVGILAQRQQRADEALQEAHRMVGEAETLNKYADEADRKAEELEGQVRAKLEEWGMADLPSARDYACYNEEISKRRAEAENKLEGLLSGRKLDQLRNEQVRLQGQERELEGQLSMPEMQAAAMSDAEYGELRQRVEQLEKARANCEEKKLRAEVVLDSTRGAGEELLSLEETLAEAEEKYQALQRLLEALTKAEEWIDAALEEARREAHETLIPTASRFLEKLTAGRYNDLFLDVIDAKLAPSVGAAEKGGPAATDELSYATREQVYLALRLAMCEALWPEEGPPLILDEPLLAFDETRRAGALELLRDLATRRQLIILTCSRDYDAIAANRIELSRW